MGAVVSPKLWYKRNVACEGTERDYAIDVYDALDAEDAVGYLMFTGAKNANDYTYKPLYIPYVAVGHTLASHLHFLAYNGTEYALKRGGILPGVDASWATEDEIPALDAEVRKDSSSDSYNVYLKMVGNNSSIGIYMKTWEQVEEQVPREGTTLVWKYVYRAIKDRNGTRIVISVPVTWPWKSNTSEGTFVVEKSDYSVPVSPDPAHPNSIVFHTAGGQGIWSYSIVTYGPGTTFA